MNTYIKEKILKFLNKQVDNNKAKLILLSINLLIWTISLIICLVWYDFKLFIIIWAMLFANNIQQTLNKM